MPGPVFTSQLGVVELGALGTITPTSLDGLVLAAKRRCDRVNAPIPIDEWYAMVNASVQELYGVLCSTYQDYNVKQFAITLAGGSQAGNSFGVGPGSSVPDFFQPRMLWLQVQSSLTPFVTIPRLGSFNERNLYTYPNIVPVYGAIPSAWNLLGSIIEILPSAVGGQSYVLWYVPVMPTLVNGTDTIDSYWLTVNGWSEFVVVDVARKAALKEESYELAQALAQEKEQLRERILREALPRDVSQPQSIIDMGRVRNPWAGWFPGGGNGFGGDFGAGGGNW